MSSTKRNKLTLIRSTYKKNRETKISIGPDCHIRAKEYIGPVFLSQLDPAILFDGCDWQGALAIFNYLPSSHKSICDNEDYYFMMPEKFNGELIRENALFIVLFHHIYNYILLKEPWTCPPFRSPIKVKYEYLQRVFNSGDCLKLEFLEDDLLAAQNMLRHKQYNNWSEFISIFKEPWSKAANKTYHSEKECLDKLSTYCENADDVIKFLKSPIDNNDDIVMEIIPLIGKELVPDINKNELDALCNIVLDKIDQHIIFQQTGVKPIPTDRMKELDLYLFS